MFLFRIPTNRVSAWFTNFKFAAKKIDVFSRVLFPGVFAVFNFLYWTYFLTREQRERELEFALAKVRH